MKEFPVILSGVRTKKLTLVLDEDNNEIQLLVDGDVAQLEDKPGHYSLFDDNWNSVSLEFGMGEKGEPWLTANGQPVRIGNRLLWYEWIWIGFPFLLVFAGGLIGGIFGGLATALNHRIMRSQRGIMFRYGLSAFISICAITAFIIAAVTIRIALDDKSPSVLDSFKTFYANLGRMKSKPSDIPNLYLDNGSGEKIFCTIDGKSANKLEIPPYDHLETNIRGGKHKFFFTDSSGKEVNNIEAEIPSGSVLVVNPQGLCNYVTITATYSTSMFNMAGGTGVNNVSGQKTITADYGLSESLPETIKVQVKTSELYSKTFKRTAVLKALPDKIPSPLAYNVLKKFGENKNCYYFYDKDYAISVLLRSLGADPKSKEHMELLLDYAEKSADRTLDAALTALNNYPDEIPDDKLMSFIMIPGKYSSGISSDSPAAKGCSGWAMTRLIKRGKGDAIVSKLKDMPETQRDTFLKILIFSSDANPELTVKTAKAMLGFGPPADEFALTSILQLVASGKVILDDELISLTDDFMAKIPREDKKKHWQKILDNRVLGCAQTFETLSPKVVDRIIEIAKRDQYSQRNIIKLLAAKGKVSEAAGIMKDSPAYVKTEFIYSLPKENPDENTLKAVWEIYETDKDQPVRNTALWYLGSKTTDVRDFLDRVWKSSADLDEKESYKLNNTLLGLVRDRLSKLKTEDFCALAAVAPSEVWAKDIISRISRQREERPQTLESLTKAYAAAKSAENRKWIMKYASNDISYLQFAQRDSAEEFAAFRKFFGTGMADSSPEARAFALYGAFKLSSIDWPSDEEIQKVINAEKDEKKRAELELARDRRTVEIWRNKTHDLKFRRQAIAKLLAVAKDCNDEQVAGHAAGAIPRIDNQEKDFITQLIELTSASKYPRCRQEAVRKLLWLDISKMKNVMDQLVKSLDDTEPDIRRMAFNTLQNQIRNKGNEWLYPKLKSAANKEPVEKLRSEMERRLEDFAPKPLNNKPQKSKTK